MSEEEKSKDMPMPSAKAFAETLRERIDIEKAYSKLCLKCRKGMLLPVDRVVSLGRVTMRDEFVKKIGYAYSPREMLDISEQKGIVKVWKCSNPECNYEVK